MSGRHSNGTVAVVNWAVLTSVIAGPQAGTAPVDLINELSPAGAATAVFRAKNS
jgi:hypothetical protein